MRDKARTIKRGALEGSYKSTPPGNLTGNKGGDRSCQQGRQPQKTGGRGREQRGDRGREKTHRGGCWEPGPLPPPSKGRHSSVAPAAVAPHYQ